MLRLSRSPSRLSSESPARVAERVVVGLEAVEVEQQEEPPGRVPAVEEGLEALHQRAPVAETGQLVGERLDPRCSEHRQVLVEGQRHARDHGGQPERCRDQRDRIDAVEVIPDLDRETDARGRERRDEQRPAFEKASPKLRSAARTPQLRSGRSRPASRESNVP